MVGRALLLIAIAGLASSTVYLFLALIAALRFRFAPPEASPSGERDAPLPAVSLLKPLHGMEPQLEENLESFFRQDYSIARPSFENTAKQFQWIKGQWEQRYQSVDLRHREFPPDLAANYRGYEFQKSELRGLDRQPFGLASTEAARRDMKLGAPVVVTGSRIPSAMEAEAKNGAAYFGADKRDGERGAPLPPQTPDLSQVTARKNLSETAFF